MTEEIPLKAVLNRIISEYGAIGGIRIGNRNLSTWRDPVPAPFCPL
jgi:hypothetical protein